MTPCPLLDKSEELFNDAPSRAATPVVGSTTELKNNRTSAGAVMEPGSFDVRAGVAELEHVYGKTFANKIMKVAELSNNIL
jgi:hypothetical protein